MPTLTDGAIINSFIGELKYNLFTRWNSMTQQQRVQTVVRGVRRTMAQVGVPAPQIILKQLPPLECGCFNPFNQWSITVNIRHFPNGGMSVQQAFPALAVSVGDTIYHEMRHCEQFWHVARYLATNAQSPAFLARQAQSPVLRKLPLGSPVAKQEGAAQIHKQTLIPLHIINLAMTKPMRPGDPMAVLAKACFESVYGASNRDVIMTALSLTPQQIPAEPADLLNDFHHKVHRNYSGVLPEEVDAWAVGGRVRAAMGG